MDKVVDFATAKIKHDLAALNQKEEKTNRIKEAIKKLPGYRGDVPSKNTIRGLPDLKPGQIFWVEMDKKAYVVAALNGKKVTIKALDETASVSTNMTIYDMNKSIVSKEPLYDLEEDPDNLADRVAAWFNEDCPPNTYYLLYGRDIHYVTLIKTPDGMATNPSTFNQLVDLIKDIGDLISMDFNTEDGASCIEIWIRTRNSDAELLYLMPYDAALVVFE